MRSPLGRAIGLGSAKEGVQHWWAERVSGLALVPLSLWFVAAIVELAGADRDTFVDWVRNPLRAGFLVLLLIATFYHGALGLQVVVEDYIENEAQRLALIVVMRAAAFLLAVLGIVAVLQLSLGA
ncbi:MAG TPA: succinate dehydrogenase, hydrophobic membrane anchor protein [Stellaceae bacterium]|nr:succinate dehydrogenase, hydrophobic membrane anchor protein [Stellaceae bacterium]